MDLYNASMGDEDEPETIELTLEQYEEAKEHFADIIAKGDAARRLNENDDFKLLVMTGYLSEEPVRMAELMSSGRLNDKVFGDCTDAIKAVAKFREYLKNILNQSNMAADELAGLEQARDLAIKEAAGE
ncbi:hypothetical protein PP753_gp45 [Dinoroseobacter phage vB_DshP-R7L]|uniref:Uncharacterized protein n=1 Tax=Dinoroseobacter phage vB_DshP-R7L TaxID=2873349 RepID=A0AAE9BMR2_9CAUD|nr:hypothetical protein PP753_gp45 [Dinoroseobacter phage vB_DshP-R7L]UAT28913.1 hypothetical protein R7L_gp74 [Dinoroseobacter phage vB_DshP-R7L]